MKKIAAKQRLRYWFDNTMSRGPVALIGWLFILSAAMILLISLIVYLTNLNENWTFWEVVWASLMRTLDAGTMGGDEGQLPFLLAMLAVTLGGIFTVSLLIGVLTSGIEGKLEELQKGRSLVVEENHTVILGWSPQVFPIISELVIANANQRRPCIAILAPQDKVNMENEIRDKVGSTGRTRVVCRTGNPIDLSDLEIISPHSARSIIILRPESGDADSHTIKTILALTNNPNRRPEPYHIVAEIRDPKNLEVAQLVARGEAQLVLVEELVARITAQTCRQSGLSVVYTELLDFGGDEIYFREEPGLVDKTYGESLLSYADSCVIGIRRNNGDIQLNPSMDYCIKRDDQIIAVSADDDTILLSGLADHQIDSAAIQHNRLNRAVPERTLILGWNRIAPRIIEELNNYVAPGSEVTVVAELPASEMSAICQCDDLGNQAVSYSQGDPTDRRFLDQLNLPGYQHVITLGDGDGLDPQTADAKTLVTLLHLRDISDHHGHPFSIVSEMLDMRNRALAEVTRADDFIVSDRLVSLILTQISENKELSAVFQDLFDPDGSELYLKPAGDYVQLGRSVNFYTVVESAREKGETALGYRLRAAFGDSGKAYGVKVNPVKAESITFSQGDRIIVLAED